MATTETDQSKQTRRDSGPSRSPEVSAGPSGAERLVRGLVVLGVILGLVAVAAFYGPKLLGGLGKDEGVSMLTHRVETDDLLITITEDGNVESAVNLELRCEVAGGSSILWIVPDGETVEEGDKIVELDQAALEDQISGQKIIFERARSTLIQAEKDYEVAKISVEEYLEGTFKISLQDADAQITIAEENLRTSQNVLAHSERMFRRGYIGSLELEGQQFSVQRAKLELDSATTAKDVLEKFTKVKTLEELSSQVETAQAKMESEKAAFDLEEGKLKRFEDQLDKCVIYAPQAGMVVYSNASGGRFGGSQGPQIEEGAQVRERQSILKLPDLTQMQVKVNVHETKVENLARNMRARIQIQDLELQGTVDAIANQPEASSRFMGNVKEYATTVSIEGGDSAGLKPGMTAEVEILVAHLKDVLTVPVAAIVEQRGQFLCWVKDGQSVQRRTLMLGMSNDQFVEIKDGLAEGDQVVLNPRAVVSDARGGEEGPEDVNVDEKFGAEKSSDQTQPEGEAQGGRGAGRGGGGREGGGGRRGGSGGGGGGFDLKQFDTNSDGQVSKDELPERMQGFFDQLDGNGDGVLDASEIEAMRNRSRSGGGRGGGGGGGRRSLMDYDTDGDGRVTLEEAPQMQRMFDRFDTNGDGAIDQSEVDTMRSQFGGGGGRGGGER